MPSSPIPVDTVHYKDESYRSFPNHRNKKVLEPSLKYDNFHLYGSFQYSTVVSRSTIVSSSTVVSSSRVVSSSTVAF